jgi:N-acetylglucosamine-6-phosphate deacetylase
MSELTALVDATIFTGEAFVEGHALVIRDGKILDIASRSRVPADAVQVSCAGQIIAPGFIDAQVNGGGNVLLNNAPSVDAALKIAAAHQKYGTTRLLLTCFTAGKEISRDALASIRTARAKNPGILGAHMEGPHLSDARRGVHKAALLRSPDAEDLAALKPVDKETLLVTVAPECVTPQQIKTLKKQGVVVAIGHTEASVDQTREALSAGASGFTHLFNGMGGLNARSPGPAGVALDDRASWCSLIIDGFHVAPEMARLAIRAKPVGKIFFVSDAMAPSASDAPQAFQLYGETIMVENGRCVNSEGKLAGAVLTMGAAVRNSIQKFGIDPAEALSMATAAPAAFLGLDTRFGKLLPGFDADIVALDTDWNVKSTWISGRQIAA